MTERGQDDRDVAEPASVCGVCGTPHQPGDRFCAQCGAPLTADAREQVEAAAVSPAPAVSTAPGPPASSAESGKESERDPSAWVFAAPPGVVAGGGLLLVLLAVLLLAVGQLDDTGTLVMLSFCAAPLGLIVVVIAIVRFVLTRRG